MDSCIELNDVRFFAFHGVSEQERKVGNEYEVSLRVACDLSAAAASDRLEETLDYGELYALLKAEMERPSKLLEHVAGRIVAAVHRRFPACGPVQVRIGKLRPPVAGEIGAAVVEITG